MSVPSLRQQMINEALDYHMNMNHVVFNRQRKSVQVSGQDVRDETQSDVIIEGTIRSKINDIMSNIQRLIQTIDYGSGNIYSQPSRNPPDDDRKVREEDIPIRESKDDEEVAAGLRNVRGTPSGKNPEFNVQRKINDALTSILSSYNSLCDYIDVTNRQKRMSQKDVSNIDGLVKQLIDPLKTVLAMASGGIVDRSDIESMQNYTRIYNVIKDIITKIQIGMPFQKADINLISSKVPIKEEYIEMASFDPFSKKNKSYLSNIYNKLAQEKSKLDRMPQDTKLEQEARSLLEKEFNRQMDKLKTAGYVPDEDYEDFVIQKLQKEEEYGFNFEEKFSPEAFRYVEDIEARMNEAKTPQELASLYRTGRDYIDNYHKTLLSQLKYGLKDAPPEIREYIVTNARKTGGSPQYLYDGLVQHAKRLFLAKFGIRQGFIKRNYEKDFDAMNMKFRREVTRAMDERRTMPSRLVSEDERRYLEMYQKLSEELPTGERRLIPKGRGKQHFQSSLDLQSKSKPKKGGHIHKTKDFEDDAELEPYLTKHLRPSKYRNNVPPIESSSEESSGEEGEGSDMEIDEMRLGKGRKKGTRKQRKQKEDIAIISSLPAPEAMIMVEKKKRAPRMVKGGRKPVLESKMKETDLWF